MLPRQLAISSANLKYNDKNSKKSQRGSRLRCSLFWEAFSWPGNVRELESIIKRLALSASNQGLITGADLRRVPEFDQFANAGLAVSVNLTDHQQVSRATQLYEWEKERARSLSM